MSSSRAATTTAAPTEVEFRTSALGRSTHYTLQYDYSHAPQMLAWTMVKGDIQRSIEGAYRFAADQRRRHRACSTTWRSSWSCRCPAS